jgi:hypothetical protein
MTKAKISEYDAVAANNTDVNGVNIAENCPPSGMNNMGREIMAALKRFQTGSDGDGVTVGGNLVVSGSSTLSTTSISSADINAGTIDGTVIGGSTAAAGSFTTLNTSGAVVFNDAGADVDFRVEGDTDANLLFVDAGADKVGIGTNTFNTNGGVLQVSNGISFPATQSASSDANTLDDYEEGTFTPSFLGSTTNPTVGYNWRFGYYTKIGNQVTVWFGVNTATYTGGSGNLYVNLPFVSANRSDNRIPGSIRSTIAFTGNVMIVPYNYENTNEVYFSAMTAAGGITAFLSVSAVSPGGAAQICLTYTV